MSRRVAVFLPLVALACAVVVAAQAPTVPRLALRWELVDDVFDAEHPDGVSRAVFILTNVGETPLADGDWAIHLSALEPAAPERVLSGGVRFTHLGGDQHRLAPVTPEAATLAPGASLRIEYLTRSLVTNLGEAEARPYLVLTRDPSRGHPIDFAVTPFTRPPQQGRDPRLVTPAEQYRRNAVTRERAADDLPPVLPTPAVVQRRTGRLVLAALPAISASAELTGEAALLRDALRDRLPPQGPATAIRLAVGRVRGFASPEAYELDVDPRRGVRITGNSAAGVFYGTQTLRHLLPVGRQGEVALPALRIADAPRFGYRGLMLDVARNFQPKARVLRVLDLMARYKLNTLHFHLTDDEGWRLEIPALPELTSVGARRGHSADGLEMLPPAFGSGPDAGSAYGSGFYSTADYVEILRYARARHIEVVPEIEMPGHARAALRAMEARHRARMAAGDPAGAARYRLVEPEDRSVYRSAQRYSDNVMNPALDSTYAFIEAVVAEVARVHRVAGVPLRWLHAGGDEVPAGAWERSPAAETARASSGAGHVRDLWFPFYARVEQILATHQIGLAGWEEIALRLESTNGRWRYEPNPDFAHRQWRAYVWNNTARGAEDLAYRLANRGYQVVLTPVSHLYFDLAASPNPEDHGLHWGGYVDADKPFRFIPLDYTRDLDADPAAPPRDPSSAVSAERLTPEGARNIVGIQGNLWGETLYADGRLDEMLLPKLFGLAERAWAPEPDWSRERESARATELYRAAWSTFATVVGKRELPRLIVDDPGVAYRIPTPGLSLTADGAVAANLQLPGFVLRYTTDGTEPTATSTAYVEPVRTTGTIAVAAFDATGRRGSVARLSPAARQ